MAFMTRTPLRVSFFGGGTDYPEYFRRHPGAVVGMGIDKYIYIAATKMRTPIAHNYRVAYSKLELVDRIEDIQHPVVRAVLEDYGVTDKLDINVMSDLPATGGGLGSSSAFTVGFVNLISAMSGEELTKIDLAREAMRFERDVLQENVGVQDQMHAAFGGLNRFDFEGDRIRISPVQVTRDTLAELNESMLLIYTGVARRATDVLNEQVAATRTQSLDYELVQLYQMVGECVGALESSSPNVLRELGRLLNESWRIKRKLTSRVSSDAIDALYERALSAGAYGGKLCGAGGGGFLMMLAPPDRHAALAAALAPHAVLPISMDAQGSAVLMAQRDAREIQGLQRQGAPALRVVNG